MNERAQLYYQQYESDLTMQQEVEPVSYLDLFRFSDKWDIVLMVIGSAFAVGNGISLIFYALPFGRLIAAFDPNSPPQDIVANTLLSVYDFLTNSAIVFINSWFMSAAWSITSQRQMIRARKQYFASLLRHQTAWHDRNKPEQVCSKMYIQIADVHAALINNVTSILSRGSIGLCGIILALIKGWRMSLVMLAFLPLMILAGLYNGKYVKIIRQHLHKIKAKIDAKVIQVFDNARTVKTLSGQQYQQHRFERDLQRVQQQGIQNGIKAKFFFGLFFFCILINYTLGFWYGAKLVSEQTYNDNSHSAYSVSDVITIFFTIYMSNLSLSGLPQAAASFNVSRKSMARIIHNIDRQPRILDGQNPCPRGITQIRFNNVNFCFQNPLFNDFNLVIKPGITALIGQSGNGKTTVVNLICRFYDIFDGSITFINSEKQHPLNQISSETLRQRIGYVGQQPVLLGSTLRDVLGGSIHKDQQLKQVLQDCRAWQFVSQIGLDNQYQSLSGGQKQRIAIARALLKNPEILILDQGTSALDRMNEQQILHSLRLRGIPFVIMIAHRLQTVVHADYVIVLQRGKIKAEGSYQQMLRQGIINQSQPNFQSEESQIVLVQSKIDQEEKKIASLIKIVSKQQPTKQNQDSQQQEQEQSNQLFQWSFFARLLGFNSNYKAMYVIGGISAAFIGAIFPVYAFILSRIIVTLAGISFSTDPDTLAQYQAEVSSLSLAMFIISFAGLILVILKGSIFTFLTQKLGTYLKRTSFSQLIQRNMDELQQQGAQTYAHIVNTNCQDLKHMGGFYFSDSIENLVTILVGLLIALAFSWQITLVSFAVFPLIILSGKIQMSFSLGMTSSTDKQHKRTHQIVTEAVLKQKTVRSLGIEKRLIDSYENQMKKALKMAIKYGNLTGIMFGIGQSLISILLALIFLIGALLLRAHSVTVLNLYTAIYAIMFGGVQAGGNMLFLGKIAGAKTAAIKYFTIVARQNSNSQTQTSQQQAVEIIVQKNPKRDSLAQHNILQINDDRSPKKNHAKIAQSIPQKHATNQKINQQASPNSGEKIVRQNDHHQIETLQPQNVEGKVELQNIYFSYRNRQEELFSGLNINIPKGTKVALVGESGSGKSTISSLILRIYDPQKGNILLDGKNILHYTKSSLRRTIGLVNQEPVLFNRSVFENIRYNTPATYEQVIMAAKKVNIYDVIMGGNFGYKQQQGQQQQQQSQQLGSVKTANEAQFKAFKKSVGPKGSHLSGGQKQRIAIARALIRNPKVLILDQATSALDNNNEQLIQECINSLSELTQIIIAHRLSTVENCDHILVMQHGKIVEEGTYNQLLRKKGYFYQLVNAGQQKNN